MSRSDKNPPVIEIDENDPFGWMRLIAALVWGDNPKKMNRVLASFSSELIGLLQDIAAQPAPPATLTDLAHYLGVAPEELVRMPGSASFSAAFFGRPKAALNLVTETVFKPAGNYRAVAEAPASMQILVEYQKAAQGGPFYAGILLSLIARMHCQHPELGPSLNRAIAVMEGWSKRGEMRLPSDRTLLSAWKEWRHLAPLWAASTEGMYAAASEGLSAYSGALEAIKDPTRFRQLLGHAKWFRTFAVSFSAGHAAAPLVPEAKAIRIIAPAPEEKPLFAPLRAVDLDTARRYLAPTRNYHD
jgi:hypothetical protein